MGELKLLTEMSLRELQAYAAEMEDAIYDQAHRGECSTWHEALPAYNLPAVSILLDPCEICIRTHRRRYGSVEAEEE